MDSGISVLYLPYPSPFHNGLTYFTIKLATRLERTLPAVRVPYPSVSLLLSNEPKEYWNLHQLSIDYAAWPRLRSRLNLGGRTLPRKPWIFDGEDSHFAFVTHSDILTSDTSTSPHGDASTVYRTLPYQQLIVS